MEGYSRQEKNFWGDEKTVHYDSHGKKIGETRIEKDFWGTEHAVHYDDHGNKVGRSENEPTIFGNPRTVHYDTSGNRIGESRPGKSFWGEPIAEHYDSDGKVSGHSKVEKDFWGEDKIVHNTGAGGCYIATAVYGSYDCPQVWTLRRYRDYTLAGTWYGRFFIHIYYAISPTLVKWFGHTEWFKKMCRDRLDRMVTGLQAQGVEDTPYEDKVC